jgi:SAM-dependent methyltransferase
MARLVVRCEELGVLSSDRLFSPSAARNRGPISEVLSQVLPEGGLVLEVGSGTGQHVVQFARAMPKLIWQPSERDADCLRSIRAWHSVEALPNVRPPLHLDVNALPWPVDSAAALVCINMIHIAPWSAAEALFSGCQSLLSGGGLMCLYGPFKRDGRHTSPSNKDFDALLRRQDPGWGVRDLDEVSGLAGEKGLDLLLTHEMPSNNLTIVFHRRE